MYTGKSIDFGSIEVYAKSENVTDLVRRYFLCVVGDSCAIEAGSNFVLPLSEVPKDVLEVIYFYTLCI